MDDVVIGVVDDTDGVEVCCVIYSCKPTAG